MRGAHFLPASRFEIEPFSFCCSPFLCVSVSKCLYLCVLVYVLTIKHFFAFVNNPRNFCKYFFFTGDVISNLFSLSQIISPWLTEEIKVQKFLSPDYRQKFKCLINFYFPSFSSVHFMCLYCLFSYQNVGVIV